MLIYILQFATAKVRETLLGAVRQCTTNLNVRKSAVLALIRRTRLPCCLSGTHTRSPGTARNALEQLDQGHHVRSHASYLLAHGNPATPNNLRNQTGPLFGSLPSDVCSALVRLAARLAFFTL